MGSVEPVGFGFDEVSADLQLSFFYLRPEFIVDDPQFWHLCDNPFTPVVHAGFPLLGLRVLTKVAPIEDEASNIGLVIQNACSAVAVAADRCVAPKCAPWSGYRRITVVELDGHLLRRSTQSILLENPANDLGLFFINLPQTRDAIELVVMLQLHAVAIRNSTGRFALADCGLHAFSRLKARLLDRIVADDCAKAELHVVHGRGILHGPEFDALVPQLLQDAGAMLHVAGDAVHRQAEKNIDAAPLDRPQDVLDARPHLEHRATDSAVVIDASNGPAPLCGEFACEVDLCLDRLLVLSIGRVTRVDDDVLRHANSILK
ncbi:hypothetical protein [Ciceribacter sp. L1K23]|uniref:hypothetical protein n=1 Tax=Ciceribacter sp. L1K23 TaxID=2820276 RepID=UPI002012BF19|nr:hypothetical protein [Ciceribacter sp. L1K23]